MVKRSQSQLFDDNLMTPKSWHFLLRTTALLGRIFAVVGLAATVCLAQAPLRPPAVPLVLHDPYFSIWSPHDRPTDGDTIHWTGTTHRLTALVRINGKSFRLLGAEPKDCPAFADPRLRVTPTQTSYSFDTSQVSLTLSFLTPALPDDLDLLSRPVTYIAIQVKPKSGTAPDVQLYIDAAAEIAVNTPDQNVSCASVADAELHVLRVGTVEQPILSKQGDDLRIDWGHFYLATEKSAANQAAILTPSEARSSFRAKGELPAGLQQPPAAAAKDASILAMSWNLGRVNEARSVSALVSYDDVYAIRYLDADLRPYWRRNGADMLSVLKTAARDYSLLQKRCTDFDTELMTDAERVGGPQYARLVALCHRQSLAGTKLAADERGQPLFFSKENNSNGCVGTVDVFYPQAPHLLLLSPALLKATLVPILDYAGSARWKFDFAPHDLGRYPHATGQVYGGGEKTLDRQMMVEESANMVLLLAALAKSEGNATFAQPYWPLLEKWTAYLEKYGYDPENQLCTDDFAGHLAHNVNLSAKAICALGAYGQLAELSGKRESAEKTKSLAQRYATQWLKEAAAEGHSRLAFDRPGTWSQKYNLVWDRILGLGLFPDDAIQREITYYRSASNKYGLPLDSRSTYTKLDWILWTAAMAKNRDDFDALVNPVLLFVNETPDRIPLTDWYFTDSGKWRGFKARPVIGGVFTPMLTDATVWKKWSSRGANTTGPWALLPLKDQANLVATGEDQPATWFVNEAQPANETWRQTEFRQGSEWKTVDLPLGVNSDSGTPIRTQWTSREVWAVRDFDLAKLPQSAVSIRITHSAPVQVWINGVPALNRDSSVRGYQNFAVSPQAMQALRVGSNRIALHTRAIGPRPQGRAVIDVGLIAESAR
jgi:Glutaminase A six helical-hairpin domain/Domain of unknown function (DUF5127)/Domain of unknown function (DUF4964)